MHQSAGTTETAGTFVQRATLRFAYPVLFVRGLFAPNSRCLEELVTGAGAARTARFLVVIDDGVERCWPGLRRRIVEYFAHRAPQLELSAEPLVVAGGERAKNDTAVVERVHERLFGLRFDRHSYLLAIGGGAMLDAVGYAAALFHRGLRLVRAPTTVLAQDDAGVGVKNGINAFGVKNALGTFAPPFAVVNDFDFLETLPSRDHIAGIAEAIKVALIRDRAFFEWIAQNAGALRARDAPATMYLIRRCAELHLEHIREGGDPFEAGSARPLDFGHWAAHRLEVLTQHELRHGEAVAIGMCIDTQYARLRGLLDERSAARVEQVIRAVGLPTGHEALRREDPTGRPSVLSGLEEFREHLGGELSVTVLSEIGRGAEVHQIDEELMRAAVRAATPD